MEEINIVRTKTLGCFRKVGSAYWGSMLIATEDPLGIESDDDEIDSFQLIEDFPKIPAKLWEPVISLFEYMCPVNCEEEETLETSIVFLRKNEGGFKEWRILVPLQKVNEVAVKAKLDGPMCDIITGEQTEGIPEGWAHAGSAHSHNIMEAYFSQTDDEDELSIPGLHVVVGQLNTGEAYDIKASVVLRGIRKEIRTSDVINLRRLNSVSYHPNVIDYIKKPKPLPIEPEHVQELKNLEKFEKQLDGFHLSPRYKFPIPHHFNQGTRMSSEPSDDYAPLTPSKLPKQAQEEIEQIHKKIKKLYKNYPQTKECFLPWD